MKVYLLWSGTKSSRVHSAPGDRVLGVFYSREDAMAGAQRRAASIIYTNANPVQIVPTTNGLVAVSSQTGSATWYTIEEREIVGSPLSALAGQAV